MTAKMATKCRATLIAAAFFRHNCTDKNIGKYLMVSIRQDKTKCIVYWWWETDFLFMK